MRYFTIEFPSKKTAHPEGDKKVIIIEQGLHKKQACELARFQLEDMEGPNAEFFKLPKVIKELSLEEFEELTKPEKEEPAKEEAPIIETGFDNHDESEGLTITALNSAVAAAVMFYGLRDYTTKQTNEIVAFIGNPMEHAADREELEEYTVILQEMFKIMPNIYKSINDGMLIQLVEACKLALQEGRLNIQDYLISIITDTWVIEYQPELKELEPEFIEVKPDPEPAPKTEKSCKPEPKPVTEKLPAPEPEPELSFVIPAFIPKCTFDDDLKELNLKLDNLAVGESLIISDLSNALYHASNSYSKSSLDLIQKDPALLQWAKNAPRNEEKEQTFIFGSAFHTMVLEPHLFDSEYTVLPELNLRTTAGKAEKVKLVDEAKRKGLSFLCADEMKQLKLMHGSVFAHPTAAKLFKNGQPEQSIFYRMSNNLVLRIRPDWLTQMHGKTFIVDLKSCPDADKFEKSVDEYGYHAQDAFYTHIYELATGVKPVFVFCATGKAIAMGKYPTRLCILEQRDKDVGHQIALDNVLTLQDSLNSNIWGGFETISRPYYARRNDNI